MRAYLISCMVLLTSFSSVTAQQFSEVMNSKSCEIRGTENNSLINIKGDEIETRIQTPDGFERLNLSADSYGYFLRKLKLKPHESQVLYYDGKPKINKNVYIAVIQMEIGNRNLLQCADAVMLLWGEYLFKQQKYDEIHFNYLSDGKPRYFKEYCGGDYSYPKFRKFMNKIFAYANTTSLYDELIPADFNSMQIGDVFISRGNPIGHAVIIADMAVQINTGEKIFLLAQSYMPAQEIQILVNRTNRKISPWYDMKNQTINTPEWTFDSVDLRRFSELK
jgi:hypothetical protein